METPSWSVAAVVALVAGVSSRQAPRGRVSKAIFGPAATREARLRRIRRRARARSPPTSYASPITR
ncbi:hypothetical protein SANTM175S_05321 [Streptomyces antimycoticus]